MRRKHERVNLYLCPLAIKSGHCSYGGLWSVTEIEEKRIDFRTLNQIYRGSRWITSLWAKYRELLNIFMEEKQL